MEAIRTEALVKRYNGQKAVDGVTITVGKGEIFGLLGPNGAGKTTLISMLVTMRRPTSGSAYVNGFDVHARPADVRRSIGVVFQDPSLDEELTARENLELHAAMYGVKKGAKERMLEVAALVGLEDRLDARVKTFSGGMRRRLEIARGLLHYPKVLFLDEPTLGLDPQTRAAIWEYIRKLRKEQDMTIVLTTHYMEEADAICDRIAIIDHGKIVKSGTPSELKDGLHGDTITVETADADRLAGMLSKEGITGCSKHGGKLTFRVKSGEKRIPEIVGMAGRSGVSITSVSLHKPTLDDVFLHYTGRTIREENSSALDSMRMHRKVMHR